MKAPGFGAGWLAAAVLVAVAVAPPAFAKRQKRNAAVASPLTANRGDDAVARGDKLYEHGRLYPATIEYSRAIEAKTTDPLARRMAEFKMGKTLYKLRFYAAALSYFDRVAAKGNVHPHYNETLQWLAALTRELPDSAGVLEKIGKYDRSELENPQLSTVRDELYFLLGKYNYGKSKLEDAIALFAAVRPKSPFYVRAKLFEGAAHVREYDARPAVEAFKEVLRAAEDSSDPKVREFRDLAYLALARVFYSTGQFVLATKYFDRVSPDSYDWPNSLFESSWANFMLKEAGYSKALGSIHTLRSPFFEYFIKPESAAEALTLKATIYYYNCLFDRASDAMAEFEETVPQIKEGLEALLRRYQDNAQFFDLAVEIRRGRSGMPPDVERAARTVLIDRSLARRFKYVRELDREMAQYDKADVAWKSTAVANNVLSDIGVSRALVVSETGNLARLRIQRLHDELVSLMTRVLKIKYEILEGQKREEEADLRDEQARSHARKAREIVTVAVDDEHQLWPFTGEYWRDELGYYRYRLANKCGRRGIPEGAPAPSTVAGSEGGGGPLGSSEGGAPGPGDAALAP